LSFTNLTRKERYCPDACMRQRFEDWRGFTAAFGFSSVFLMWGLWLWSLEIDPSRGVDALPHHLLMGVVMLAYPGVVLVGRLSRKLPWLLYGSLLLAQTIFMMALSRLDGGLSHGYVALLGWLLMAAPLSFIFPWRFNLLGVSTLLLWPALLALIFGTFSSFPFVRYLMLATPSSIAILLGLYLADRLSRQLDDIHHQQAWRQAAIRLVEEAVHVTDGKGTIEFVNPAFTRITGYESGEVLGRNPSLLGSDEQDAAFFKNMWTRIQSGEVWQGKIVNRHKNGEHVSANMKIVPIMGHGGQAERYVAISRDITASARMEDELNLSKSEFEAIFDNAGVGNALLDAWGRFAKVNDSWLSILGYSREQSQTLGLKDMFPDDDVLECQQILAALSSGELLCDSKDRRFVRRGGEVFWGHLSMTPVKNDFGISSLIAVLQDINDRKLLEEKLESMAHYDALTGLPNRALFFDRLNQAIIQTKRIQGMFSLMFIDLDGFKAVNDTFGHDTGDALLKAVSLHLHECVRDSDTVARMGGDEFTIILRAIRNQDDAAHVAEKILSTLAAPYHLLGHECRIGASIGIVIYPDHGLSKEELLSQSDNAMYAVKKAGKNNYRFAQMKS
jgi:diguanylate cyclase (GGDEF)-like protein/PAS domain S-box-containing protein